MPKVVGDSTSSSQVLRCYAPPVISSAFARCESRIGSKVDRLSARLSFIETVLRYLTGIMVAEWVGLDGGLPPPQLLTLLEKIDRPSWGHWFSAADGLAALLTPQAGRMVAPKVCAVLRTPKGKQTKAATSIQGFIETRNHLAHPDGGFSLPSEARAKDLIEELSEPLRLLVQQLRFLKRAPVFYLEWRRRKRPPYLVDVARFSGDAVEEYEQIEVGQSDLEPTQPFIVGKNGDLLLLEPFLWFARSAGDRTHVLRLLSRWKGRRRWYGDHQREEGVQAEDDEWGPPGSLLELRPQDVRRTGWFSPEQAHRLREEPPPEAFAIPGCEIKRLLGRGASSAVFLGEDEQQRPVAIKILLPAVRLNPQQRKRLRNEFDALQRIEHGRIVKVHAFDEEPVPHIIMDWLPGQDLESAIGAGPLTPGTAAEIARQVLDSLSAAHSHDIIHRDIKPRNVMLTRRGERPEVCLIDFGVATAAIDPLLKITGTMEGVGTVAYAAPEQLEGKEVSPATDIYGVGRLLEFMLTGQACRLQGQDERLSPGMRALIRKACQKDPRDRFQSAAEMKDYLEERQQAGWGGAPLALEDRLGHSYVLVDLHGQVGDGYWLFSGMSVRTERPMGILVADGAARADKLATQIRELGAPRLHQLGFKADLVSEDGLYVALMDSSQASWSAEQLLAPSPPPLPAYRPAGTAVSPPGAAPGSGAPPMVGAEPPSMPSGGPPPMAGTHPPGWPTPVPPPALVPQSNEAMMAPVGVRGARPITIFEQPTAPPAALPAPPRKRVGPYELHEELGVGGMATVYRGRHRVPAAAEGQGDVAVKVMHRHLSANEDFRRRLELEARLGMRLEHQNIVRCQEVFLDRDQIALIMDMVCGRPFDDVLEEIPVPDRVDRALPLFEQLLDAVAYAHDQNVVHRDLKPGNVFVTSEGQVKLMDFGIAQESSRRLTRPGIAMGTVEYMAPEQYTDARSVDQRADIYALGVMLYELVTGRMPWPRDSSEFAIMAAKAKGELRDPRELLPELSTELAEFLLTALAEKPDERFQSVAAFRDGLRAAVGKGALCSAQRTLMPSTPGADSGRRPPPMASGPFPTPPSSGRPDRIRRSPGWFSRVKSLFVTQREGQDPLGITIPPEPSLETDAESEVPDERCPQCGATVPTGRPFCPACGTSLSMRRCASGHAIPEGLNECPYCTEPASMGVLNSTTHVLCPHCGAPVPATHRFCPACGGSLVPHRCSNGHIIPEGLDECPYCPKPGSKVCSHCQSPNLLDMAYCQNCGQALTERKCKNGHVIPQSLDKCPYCPKPRIPPTQFPEASPPPRLDTQYEMPGGPRPRPITAKVPPFDSTRMRQWLPPWLRAYPDLPSGQDPAAIWSHTQLLLAVIWAEALAAQDSWPIDPGERVDLWRHAGQGQAPLSDMLEYIDAEVLFGRIFESQEDLHNLQEWTSALRQARNLAAHGATASSPDVAKMAWITPKLFELAQRAGEHLDPSRLSPVLMAVAAPAGPPPAPVWSLLTIRGSSAYYRGLGAIPGQKLPLTPEAAALIAEAAVGEDLANRSVASATQLVEEASVGRVLLEMRSWPGVAKVERDVPVGRNLVDLLARDSGGDALVVVEVKRVLDQAMVAQALDRLWTYAEKLSAPWAALADGKTIRLYRRDEREGFIEVEGPDALS